ncbi:pyridoxamine 5'-phosphate oxidase [Roseimaritima sediminicola]|uniref:pyridoxamine 5'-phosphate oxidase n=1 Tax=Roseimaritima sediminicola TaxID=2662066 RepID=UPI0012983B4B|nr:pyridoxamine 5'-phosphate oxidase [Roseimaritima sediminicola]
MSDELESMRRNYQLGGLDEADVLPDPIDQFRRWFDQAREADPPAWLEVNAATLSTADRSGQVSNRIVLLKQVSEQGFTFFTNYHSIKGRQLAENPVAALCWFWPHLERQIRVDGSVEKTSPQLSDEYFQRRPRESQLGASLSAQSAPVASREHLQQRYDELARQYEGQSVPRPPHWGGYVVHPRRIEFWQGRPNRIHDRVCYTREQQQWRIERLSP